jgi:cysteinyl-tRNA synthetase
MIFELLGEQIDIHTGGIEHIPIHHNNEIAQAEAATGKQYVKYWLHNNHITLDGKKISKSLGNTVYVSDIVEKGYSPLAFRYWYLTGHYRTPTNFTWEAIAGADTALKRLENLYLSLEEGELENDFLDKFYAAIANDLDTARALALVWENSQKLNQATLKKVDEIFGLGLAELKAVVIPSEIQKMLDAREVARINKDFANSDTLRKQIEQQGFLIKDTPLGPKLVRK